MRDLLSHPSWDLVVLFSLLAISVFYGMSVGKPKLLAALFGLFVTILAFEYFPYNEFLKENGYIINLISFLAAFIVFTILFSKTIFASMPKSDSIFQILFLSIIEIGLFASAIFRLPVFSKINSLYDPSPIIEKLFDSKESFFFWLILSLVSLLFLVKRRREKSAMSKVN